MPAPHDLDPDAMTENERLAKRRFEAGFAFETMPEPEAEPDEAELFLIYMAEANSAADGSPEDGPGNMDGWPTFEEWKAG